MRGTFPSPLFPAVLAAMFAAVFGLPPLLMAQPNQFPAEGNPAIRKGVAEVSRERLTQDVETLVSFGTRHPLSPTDSPTRGVGAARRFLKAALEKAAATSGGRMTVLEVPFERTMRGHDGPVKFVNYIAHLKGTDPTRGAWVFGGHYDSINSNRLDGKKDAPGADDDASGTAVVLEMARVLATRTFPADIYLCAFDGEEHGLFGSDELAAEMQTRQALVEGMITNDIVGASVGPDGKKRNYLRCFSEGFEGQSRVDRRFRNYGAETEGHSRQLARHAELMCGRYVPGFEVRLIYRQDRFGRGGDHLSFTRRGYPGIRFTEASENYHHQHKDVVVKDGVQQGDLLEFLDFEYLTQVARLNVAVAMNGASAPPAPTSARMRGAMSHDTEISWEAAPGQGVAGYRIWMRPTEESRWQKDVFVPAPTTRHVLKFTSIDDWQFAVSTVGKDGAESPPRFPFRPRTQETQGPRRR